MTESPHLSNSLLRSLPADKMAALLPHLRTVELPQETVLFKSGDTISAVYSLIAGLCPYSSISLRAR
jgi:CRP-like cAMP-binding protein